MNITCKSLADVVGFAIEKEGKAMDFYTKCADRAINPGLKEFFKEMRQEEERHRDMLRKLDAGNLDGVKLAKIEDLQISDYLIDIEFRADLNYQDALTIAMKKEEKAHLFYLTWKEKCQSRETAKLFELLAKEEEKHKRKLEDLYDDEILSWDGRIKV